MRLSEEDNLNQIQTNLVWCSARLALPGPEEKRIVSSNVSIEAEINPAIAVTPMSLPPPENNSLQIAGTVTKECEPIIKEPATPEQELTELLESEIEDFCYEDPDEIPTIKLNMEEFTSTLQNYMQEKKLQEGDMSKALVALNPEATSIPTPKLKNVSRLRTEHQVYELPDSHPLLEGMDRREPDDPSPYLLAIWTPGETANSIQQPESRCGSQDQNKLCNEKTCFSCNSIREENLHTVKGTILIPCRTAMREGASPSMARTFKLTRCSPIMNLVITQLMFQGGGYGIYQEGPYTLELQYQQFSKVYQQREFNTAFGEVCDMLTPVLHNSLRITI
ncbi:hypothetical protein ACFX1R_027167 [Malus domestica]